MKVKTIENMAVIALDAKVDVLAKVKRYAPEALCIKDEDGNDLFRVVLNECPYSAHMGTINDLGAEFIKSGEKALIWVPIPDENLKDKDAKAEWLYDACGVAMSKVATIEAQIDKVIEEVEKNIKSVKDSFEHL